MNVSPALRMLLLVIILLIPFSAFGQIILHGTVRDSVTGEVLVGANVYIKGTSLGGVTDREGQYRIPGVSEGAVVLKVSYIGYTPKEFEINVLAGELKPLTVLLTPDVLMGEEILITAQARGQIAAINQQINARTIMNVVSEEKIKELPDANAAEALGRLPGVSIIRAGGEANRILLRGMPDKYASFTVDGVRIASTDSNTRSLDLSTISQSSLSGIELFKALTADKDGDAIAGSINLVTKKAPALRTVRFDAKGDYNKLDNTAKQYDFSGRYGERFFDDLLGVQFIGSYERRNRSNEQYTATYNTNYDNHYSDFALTDFQVDYTNEIRKRGGATLLLDVNTPDSGTIRFSNEYNRTDRNFIHYYRDYPLFGGGNTVNGGPVTYDARDREQKIDAFSTSVGGQNYFLDLTANWGLSFAQSRAEFPYDLELQFSEPSDNDSTNPAGMNGRAPSSIRHGPPEAYIPYAYNNFPKASLQWAYYRSEKNIDKQRTVFLDLTRKYALGDLLSGEFKMGGKYRQINRFKESGEVAAPYYLGHFWPYTRLADGTVVQKNFTGTPFAGLQFLAPIPFSYFLNVPPDQRSIYDKYALNPLINRDELRLWYDLNKNGVQNSNGGGLNEYDVNSEVKADYYDITERVSAAYAMNTFNFGQEITFIAGARVEKENNDYASKYTPGQLSGFPTSGVIRDTSVTYNETVWLPNFHLVVRPTDFMSVRVAAYKALARPDFNQRLEKSVARNSNSAVLYVGNPNLRSAKASNYEANLSFYGNIIGLFSISAYYKNISDMFYMVDGFPTKGQHLLDSLGSGWGRVPVNEFPFRDTSFQYNLTYPLNSPRPTKVWGFEVEQQTNFTFLPGLLSGIVLSYNFSVMRTETWRIAYKTRIDTVYRIIPPFPPVIELRPVNYLVEEKDKLEGQPEFLYNIALGYDVGGFSGRLSVFHQGSFNRSYSADARNDVVVNSFTRLDMSLKQKITDNISVLLDVNNLTNVEEGTSTSNRDFGWNLPTTSQKYGLTGTLGVRVDL